MDNVCLPTELIYDRATCQLLFWGFVAQDYLNDPFPEPPLKDVFVVENIKLLLPEPDEMEPHSSRLSRFRHIRATLIATLHKDPYEVFQDFLTCVLECVLGSAMKRYLVHLSHHRVELVLAFPSGWEEHIHTNVAKIGAAAMEKAFTTHKLTDMTFGIQHVYTVSEVLCGIKEWLREIATETPEETFKGLQDADAPPPGNSPHLQPSRIDELRVSHPSHPLVPSSANNLFSQGISS
jgi:hypothetical protein